MEAGLAMSFMPEPSQPATSDSVSIPQGDESANAAQLSHWQAR